MPSNLICWLVFLSRTPLKRYLAYPWHNVLFLCILPLLVVKPCVFCLAAINALLLFPQTDNEPSVYWLPTLVLQCYYLKDFSDFLPGIVTAAPTCLSKVKKERLQEQHRECTGYATACGEWSWCITLTSSFLSSASDGKQGLVEAGHWDYPQKSVWGCLLAS